METLLLLIGRMAGALGALLAAVAAMTRLAGSYSLGGFDVGTLLLAGAAAMIGGCLCLLVALTSRAPRRF